jgi:hypothetical protein
MIHEYGAYIFYFFLGLGLITFGLLVTTAICGINWGEDKE